MNIVTGCRTKDRGLIPISGENYRVSVWPNPAVTSTQQLLIYKEILSLVVEGALHKPLTSVHCCG